MRQYLLAAETVHQCAQWIEAIKRARGASGSGTVLPGPSGTTTQSLMDTEETPPGGSGFGQGSVSRTQMLLEEEDNMAQLQEREKSIRQLEVGYLSHLSGSYF